MSPSTLADAAPSSEAQDAGEILALMHRGPYHRIKQRLRLERDKPSPQRLAIVIVSVVWLPLVVLSLIQRLTTGEWDVLLIRAEVHTRLLLALSILIWGEPSLESRTDEVIQRLPALLPSSSRKPWHELLVRLRAWCDARTPELVLLLFVYGTTLAAYFGFLPGWLLRWLAPTLHERARSWEGTTAAWWWYVGIGQPLFLFILLRWLFRWGLWGALLYRLPALEPRLVAGHADRAGGIGFLVAPLFTMRMFVFALSATIASVWFDEIHAGFAKPATFAADLLVLLPLALSVALVPYAWLTPLLIRAQREGHIKYTELVYGYVDRFEERWLKRRGDGEALLGHPDFDGLADLGSSYSMVEEMRAFVPDREELKALLLAASLPFLVLVLVYGPSAAELLHAIFQDLIEE